MFKALIYRKLVKLWFMHKWNTRQKFNKTRLFYAVLYVLTRNNFQTMNRKICVV